MDTYFFDIYFFIQPVLDGQNKATAQCKITVEWLVLSFVQTSSDLHPQYISVHRRIVLLIVV